jgi:hypothetical protein
MDPYDYGGVNERLAVELPLSGPTFDRALVLAREAVTSVVYGGPAADGSLEFVLTEANNDRVLGATLTLLLAHMAGVLAGVVAELEMGDEVIVADHPSDQQAEEMLERALGVVTGFIDELHT